MRPPTAGTGERKGDRAWRQPDAAPGQRARQLAGTSGTGTVRVPGDRLFSVTRLDPPQWKPAGTTNATEPLNEAFRRRIQPRTALPCAGPVPMLLWALLASGQIPLSRFAGKPLPGSGCASPAAGRPSRSPSSRCPLAPPPERSQVHMPAARRSAFSNTFATRPFGEGPGGAPECRTGGALPGECHPGLPHPQGLPRTAAPPG